VYNTLSMRSKKPPCPGIREPLSFTLASRLNLDWIRSPMVAVVIITIANKGKIHFGKSVVKNISTSPIAKQTSPPPQKPSHVFFGEIEGKSTFLPQFLPKRYAKLLFVQISKNIKSVK